MKPFVPLFLLLISLQLNAQTSEVLTKLNELKITLIDLALYAQPTSKEYAFDITKETPDPQYPVTWKGTYDPTQNPAWKMTTWNDEPVVDKYKKNLLKDYVADMATTPVLVDEATLKSTTEGNYLVISFRLVAATVPKLYMYLKDCDGKAYINTTTARLEKTVWDNFQPTRNAAVRVKKIHEEVTYIFDDIYHVEKVTQFMGGSINTKVGAKNGEAEQITTYSNYKKVQ